jgi:hypothetical protein
VVIDQTRLRVLIEADRAQGQAVVRRAVDRHADRAHPRATFRAGRIVGDERRQERSADADRLVAGVDAAAPRQGIGLLAPDAVHERLFRGGGDDKFREDRGPPVGQSPQARGERIDRHVPRPAHLEVQMRQADPGFPRIADHLTPAHRERRVQVNVPGVARLHLRLPARHAALEMQPRVLEALEMTVDRHPAAGMADVDRPAVAPPLNLEPENGAGRGRQDLVPGPPAGGDVDPTVQVVVAVFSERRQEGPRHAEGPGQRAAGAGRRCGRQEQGKGEGRRQEADGPDRPEDVAAAEAHPAGIVPAKGPARSRALRLTRPPRSFIIAAASRT